MKTCRTCIHLDAPNYGDWTCLKLKIGNRVAEPLPEWHAVDPDEAVFRINLPDEFGCNLHEPTK